MADNNKKEIDIETVDKVDENSKVETQKKDNDKEKKDKDKSIYHIIIILLLIIIIILLLLRSCGSVGLGDTNLVDPPKTVFDLNEDKNTEKGEREGKSKEQIQEELNKQVTNITISMNTNPVFETGQSEGNLLIYNDKINTLPQIVEIYLKSDNTLIYKSGLIPVDTRLDTGKLNVNLAKGTYDCVAYFNAINPDTGELMGKAGAEIKLIVNN